MDETKDEQIWEHCRPPKVTHEELSIDPLIAVLTSIGF
jgi:hypothetical protein